LQRSPTRLPISLLSCANWTDYASRSGKRCCQPGNRRNRDGGMGTALPHGLIGNRPTVYLPLAAANPPNRLPQPIDRRRWGRTQERQQNPAARARRASLNSLIRPRRTLFVNGSIEGSIAHASVMWLLHRRLKWFKIVANLSSGKSSEFSCAVFDAIGTSYPM
jgi:hypothetical protein